MKKRSLGIVLLWELVVVIIAVIFVCMVSGGFSMLIALIDVPTILFIFIFTIPSLLAMGIWKDFVRAFTIGKKNYSILEIKNSIEAVNAAIRLLLLSGLVSLTIGLIGLLRNISSPELIGPNVAVAILTIFYVSIFELFTIPLKVNAALALNSAIDMDIENEE